MDQHAISANAATQAAAGVIRRLLKSETHLLAAHLLRLDDDARRRRFGHDVSAAFVTSYADGAADFGSLTYAYVVDGDVFAVAELRQSGVSADRTAEVAFSVERNFTNRGIASALMGRIIRSARNRGIRHLRLVCLTENAKMRSIAQRYGADLIIEAGSIIADIVPDRPDYISIATEIMDDRRAYIHAVLDLGTRLSKVS